MLKNLGFLFILLSIVFFVSISHYKVHQKFIKTDELINVDASEYLDIKINKKIDGISFRGRDRVIEELNLNNIMTTSELKLSIEEYAKKKINRKIDEDGFLGWLSYWKLKLQGLDIKRGFEKITKNYLNEVDKYNYAKRGDGYVLLYSSSVIGEILRTKKNDINSINNNCILDIDNSSGVYVFNLEYSKSKMNYEKKINNCLWSKDQVINLNNNWWLIFKSGGKNIMPFYIDRAYKNEIDNSIYTYEYELNKELLMIVFKMFVLFVFYSVIVMIYKKVKSNYDKEKLVFNSN